MQFKTAGQNGQLGITLINGKENPLYDRFDEVLVMGRCRKEVVDMFSRLNEGGNPIQQLRGEVDRMRQAEREPRAQSRHPARRMMMSWMRILKK